jgi:RHS repeat-associated protein
LFTGRRVDILDNGSLKIQYNRNRYYDYYTGRWLTEDPYGIVPAGIENPFSILEQYLHGMNVYEYVGSKPAALNDPWGYGEYQPGTTEPENGYAALISAEAATYNTWPSNLNNLLERSKIRSKVLLYVRLGPLFGFKRAAKWLRWYAANHGVTLQAPHWKYSDLIKEDRLAEIHFERELDDALEYAEKVGAAVGDIVTVADYESVCEGDWGNAINKFRTWSKGEDIKCLDDGKYHMRWTIFLRDIYRWRLGWDRGFSFGGAVPITHDELAKMHRWGWMKSFEVRGEYTVEVTWKCGERTGSGALYTAVGE